MEPVIAIQRVTKNFQEEGKHFPALSDISLEIQSGEFFVILGPSGSGKSTLLRVMSGLEKSFEGKRLVGAEIKPADFSFVFQQFALLPWLTVFENTAIGLIAKQTPLKRQKEVVSAELKKLGLEKFASKYPRELSGGMRQRVGLARALAVDPKVIFLDEPFSELDSFTAQTLRKELLQIWQERNLTVVMVTHLIDEALELADRIAILTSRPGKIEKIVTNKLERPRNKRSPDFFRLEDELYQLIKP